MPVPVAQMATVAGYLLRQKLRGRSRYPLVLMLEPLYRCNLACAGCGKIQYPAQVLKSHLSVEECLRAADECPAPVVSIPGGEPLLHPEIDRIVEGLVARVGLRGHADISTRQYSKGMLQRLGLAQALLGAPELLVLDEPMSGLDPIGRREVRDLLVEERERGTSILLSSHIVPDVETLADSAVFLREGLLVGDIKLARETPAEYHVRVARLPGGAAAPGVLRHCQCSAELEGESPPTVAAPDPAALARLLELCSEERIDVLDVWTCRSNLEELFLRAMRSEESEENAAC